MGIKYFPPEYTTTSRRIQRKAGSHKFPSSAPTAKLGVEIDKPCGACTIPYPCPTPNWSLQMGIKCIQHLMAKSRTWACIYNVNSWCFYFDEDFSCYHQLGAPDSANHSRLLTYRQCEMEYYFSLDGRPGYRRSRAPTLGLKLYDLRESLLLDTGVQNLSVCSFYALYKDQDHLAVINKTDPAIPKMLSSEKIALKGEAFLV